MNEPLFNSDQKIADAYGIPYLFDESQDYVMEDMEVSLKRVVGMHKAVTTWIEKHRRIPSYSPKAEPDERNIALWLKVVMFYKDVMLDPNDENKEERISNEQVHRTCQNLIRTGECEDETTN